MTLAAAYDHPGHAIVVSSGDSGFGAANFTTGDNDWKTGTGAQCGYDYLCVARKGYNAPTGLGAPDGTRAF